MKTLYLDCAMGAAGDMLTAALLELMPDMRAAVERLNQLGLPGVEYSAQKTARCGITGTHVEVLINHVSEGEVMYGEQVHGQNPDDDQEHVHGQNPDDDQEHVHVQDNVHEHEHGHAAEHGYAAVHQHTHSRIDECDLTHGHDHAAEHQHTHGGGEHTHHHDYGHIHMTMDGIAKIIEQAALPEAVRRDVLAVYQLIAQAESTVHSRPVEEVHFHEVGAMDAVADVAAVCYLMHELAPERVTASPVAVGSGAVKCAHGVLPVPAPAAALLLTGIPTYAGDIRAELCTPTGAALLKYFVHEFGVQPPMTVEKTGYGCGFKDFPQANVVRAMLGERSDASDTVIELSCNLDDISAERIGFAMDQLFAAGALDVYTAAIGMKKNRPGTMLTCMCRESDREQMLGLIFLHTTTIGVRESRSSRYTLSREVETVSTPYGDIRMKCVSGWGVRRRKAEYDDLAAIAKREGLSIAQVEDMIDHDSVSVL